MKKYTKKQIIQEVEDWINHLESAYQGSEVSMNCLNYEWKQLRKKLEGNK